eukprot:TRINITY_DN1440_c0_g1_i13.p1 TRINITY_DN1440_c0_g1~~TRINITY_DN1440_c0_g1_i13.p1  ORF type:complete len:304 (+),score=57.39 TRINITY_DN1440_c0_g1_i13:399-1310(+)
MNQYATLDGSHEVECVRVIRRHTKTVACVSMSPFGDRFVTSGYDHIVNVWDTHTGTCIKTITDHSDDIKAVCVSPSGRYFGCGSDDCYASVWDAGTLTKVASLHVPVSSKGDIRAITFNPFDTVVALGSYDGIIRTFAITGARLGDHKPHDGCVCSLKYTPDGRHLVSGSWDKSVKVWDVHTMDVVRTMTGHKEPVHAIDISPDGRLVASVSDDASIILWDLVNGTLLRTISGHSDWVFTVKFSPDGSELATGGDDLYLTIWSLDGHRIKRYRPHEERIRSLCYTPDGKQIISVSDDLTLQHQ